MKNLMRLLVAVIAITLATESFAQNFGIKAGLNLSNMIAKDDNDDYSEDLKLNPGFHFGPIIEFPINDMFSFETGLLASTKGYRVSEEETYMGQTAKFEGKINLIYADIPLTAKVTFPLGGAKIYGAFGPYVGVGITGKTKAEMTVNGETETEEEAIEWGSDEEESDLKRLDYGLNIGLGLDINSFLIGASYGLGLANVSPYTEDGYTTSHRVIGVSIGYKFGGK